MIDIIHVYNFVNANGTKLQLNLGVLKEKEGLPKGDAGLRWSFVGTKIPVPVRAHTWFNGFPEPVMLDWLKANGWALRTVVDLPSCKTKVYELPVPEREYTAKGVYNDTIPIAIKKYMAKIEEAKNVGETCCYISCGTGKPPVETIESMLDAGYDIVYSSYGKGYGNWYVKAYWHRSCEKGKIFIGDSCGAKNEVTIGDYKNA